MDSGQDITRIVRSWLGTDEHESADRVLGIVIAQLDTTRQRRSWWPARRTADMPTYAKLAIAAVSVVVVALIGITVWPRVSGPGTIPTASPAPSASPTSSPSPPASPSAASVVFPPTGELEVGRHSMTRVGIPFTFDVATSGWTSNGDFAIDWNDVGPDGAGFIFWGETPVGVFADPCASTRGPLSGPTNADRAAAVATVPGTDLVSGPADVTVGGHPATKVVVTVREDVGCAAGSFYLWYAPSVGLARFATELGSTISVWIIDVDGTFVWIDGETYKGAGPEQSQAIQQIVDSIEFE